MPQKSSPKVVQSMLKSFLEKQTGHAIANPKLDLLHKGVISSFTMFELIDFIEKKFKIKVDVLSINPDNFNTLEKISKHITVWTSK